MALELYDRVKETTTTTGTGTLTLGGASTGYRTFGSVLADSDTTYYAIDGGSEWEVGLGTIGGSGTTLARTTPIASSNAGAAVNFSAGSKTVFGTLPATLFSTAVATFLATPSSANLASLVSDDSFALNDAELGAIAGLTSAADRLPYFTGSGTASLATFTTAARNLLDDASASNMLTTLAAAGTGLANTFTEAQTVSKSQSAGTLMTVTNASDNIAATAGVRLITGSGGDYVDFFTSGNLNYFQFSGGGGIVDGRMGFNAVTLQTNAGTQMIRSVAAGVRVGSTVADATSRLMVEGAASTPITTVTGNTTLDATHSTVINNRGASNTLTLPTASTCVGRKYRIVTIQAQTVVSASSNVVPRVGGAAGTAILPATDGAWADIQSDGSNWIITASGV